MGLRYYAGIPGSGVSLQPCLCLVPSDQQDEARASHRALGWQMVDGLLPDGFTMGMTMETPVVDPPRFLQFLVDRLQSRGVSIIECAIDSPAELFAAGHQVVIICAGMGAARWDKNMVPHGGFLVHTEQPVVKPFRGVVFGEDSQCLRLVTGTLSASEALMTAACAALIKTGPQS